MEMRQSYSLRHFGYMAIFGHIWQFSLLLVQIIIPIVYFLYGNISFLKRRYSSRETPIDFQDTQDRLLLKSGSI